MTTFDPTGLGANITLSNGNLTGTYAAGQTTWNLALSTTTKSSTDGKVYIEFLVVTLPNDGTFNGADWSCGFGKGQSTGSFIGATGDDGWQRADMASFDGGAEGIVTYTTANRGWTTAVAGDVLAFAIDFASGKAWAAKNNTFGGSPGAGTNPAWTWTPAGSWFAVWGAVATSSVNAPSCTLRPNAASQSYAAPSGFSAWDAAGGTTKLFLTSSLNGLGAGGAFFHDRLA